MITHVVTDEPVAALTFDDGPHPEYTSRLLDVLDRFHVRATFFMVGHAAQGQRELVARVASTHLIGNHSWDHPIFPEVTGADRRQQLLACAEVLEPFGSPFFRPPYGREDKDSEADVRSLGYESIGWSVDAEDWMPRTPDWMADRLLRDIRPGSIVLLHDAIFRSRQPVPQYDRSATVEAVEMFLRSVAGRLQFVTVLELLKQGSPYRTGI